MFLNNFPAFEEDPDPVLPSSSSTGASGTGNNAVETTTDEPKVQDRAVPSSSKIQDPDVEATQDILSAMFGKLRENKLFANF